MVFRQTRYPAFVSLSERLSPPRHGTRRPLPRPHRTRSALRQHDPCRSHGRPLCRRCPGRHGREFVSSSFGWSTAGALGLGLGWARSWLAIRHSRTTTSWNWRLALRAWVGTGSGKRAGAGSRAIRSAREWQRLPDVAQSPFSSAECLPTPAFSLDADAEVAESPPGSCSAAGTPSLAGTFPTDK